MNKYWKYIGLIGVAPLIAWICWSLTQPQLRHAWAILILTSLAGLAFGYGMVCLWTLIFKLDE